MCQPILQAQTRHVIHTVHVRHHSISWVPPVHKQQRRRAYSCVQLLVLCCARFACQTHQLGEGHSFTELNIDISQIECYEFWVKIKDQATRHQTSFKFKRSKSKLAKAVALSQMIVLQAGAASIERDIPLWRKHYPDGSNR